METESEIIDKRRISLKCEQDFFSNNGKEERERWVVEEVLSLLNISFDSKELVSPEQSSKTDVIFRDEQFQIKEITDPEIKRTAQVKAAYDSALKAKTFEETFGPYECNDTPPVCLSYDLVLDQVRELDSEKKYENVDRSKINLLFYVTRRYAGLITTNQINRDDFSQFGWRSVVVLIKDKVNILYLSDNYPNYFRKIHKNILTTYNEF